MKTIVINSQKGGSGKTTLCAALSVEAARTGERVCLIDTDSQGTLSRWHDTRKEENPFRIEQPTERLTASLERLTAQGTAYTFIDTIPSRGEDIAGLFRLADLVLVPVRPTPPDIWASKATIDTLKSLGIPFLFVMSQVKPQVRLTAQATAILSHQGAVAPVLFADRVDYAAAFNSGHTAAELFPRGKAARETAELWESVKNYLAAIPATKEVAHA